MTVEVPAYQQIELPKSKTPFMEIVDNLRRSWGGMLGLSP